MVKGQPAALLFKFRRCFICSYWNVCASICLFIYFFIYDNKITILHKKTDKQNVRRLVSSDNIYNSMVEFDNKYFQ